MKATRDDLSGLIQLQQLDLEIMKQRKVFDELPQRAAILESRKKRTAIEGKLERVLELKKNAAARISRIDVEDETLDAKACGVQKAIEAAQGDYRNVEARTKELDGIAKRRAVLREDRAAASAELSKIEDVEAQVMLALEALRTAEDAVIAEFQQEGGALQASLAKLDAERAAVRGAMSAQIVELYDKTAARAGGVAVGVLSENRCGVCRTGLDGGRLIDLKSQAPLGICPTCKRLLIIG